MRIQNYKTWYVWLALLISVSILLLLATQFTVRKDHVYFFITTIALFPLFSLVLSRSYLRERLLRAIGSIGYWFAFYTLFLSYKNRPWFADGSKDCDGPCFGWYSFENEPVYLELLVVAGVSLGLGLLIYGGLQWFSNQRKT